MTRPQEGNDGYDRSGSEDGWTVLARVARSDLHDRTWYPYWDGGAETDMFPYCGPVRAVKRFVWSAFKLEWPQLRWILSDDDTWTLEGRD